MRLLKLPRLTWMAVGAAAAYLLDPENGSRRRQQLTRQVNAKRRQLSGESDPSARPESTWAGGGPATARSGLGGPHEPDPLGAGQAGTTGTASL